MKWWPNKKNKKNQQKSQRQFAAAQHSLLTQSWQAHNRSLNEDLYQNLATLRARSREQALNNPYVRKFLNLCKTNIVGSRGIQLQSRIKKHNGKPDIKRNQLLEETFNSWGQKGHCDVTGKYSWLDCQKLFIESIARDGEVLIRLVRGFDNDFGFALEFIEADSLDINYHDQLPNGNQVIMGIEIDNWQRPVAYHLKTAQNIFYKANVKHERIPATDIIHAFDNLRPQQLRGIPWCHSALIQLHMLNKYEDAELVAARVGASKMGFFERNELGEGYCGDVSDAPVTQAQPGTFENLPSGVSFKPWDPTHPSGNFEPFTKACLRGIASGLGVSYNGLANDLEGVNFSSIRAGVLEEREAWMVLQQWMIEQFCQPIFSEWLQMALLTQQLNYPITDYNKLHHDHWQGRRWPWVDPLKDLQAVQMELNLGLTSIDEVIRRMGRDPEEVLLSIMRSKDALTQLQLTDILENIYGNSALSQQSTQSPVD